MTDDELRDRLRAFAESLNDAYDGLTCDLFDVQHDGQGGRQLHIEHLSQAIENAVNLQTELSEILTAKGWNRNPSSKPNLRVVRDEDEEPF